MIECPRCKGKVGGEKLFVDGVQVHDVRCVNCGERFYPPREEPVKKHRELKWGKMWRVR
jgi:hypothetical protein